jgi:hypothetical protein
MRAEEVIFEYSDYRAYVSHTLWQHRVGLGLSSLDVARIRLADAAIWPLAQKEALRLCDLTGTLFGLKSPGLDTICVLIGNQCRAFADTVENLFAVDGERHWDGYCTQARDIGKHLSSIVDIIDAEMPFVSEARVKDYLASSFDKDIDWLLKAACARVEETLLGLERKDQAAESYTVFWSEQSDALYLTRCDIVAHSLIPKEEGAIQRIRNLQASLKKCEPIVSCWSPAVPVEKRAEYLAERLTAAGYASYSAFLKSVCGSL